MKQLNLIMSLILILIFGISAYAAEKSDILYAATQAYEKKLYRVCVEKYEEAIKLGADSEDTYYNYARCLAKTDQKDKAFEYLEKAFESGFINTDKLKKDKDLISLHNDKRWLVVVSKAEKYREKYFDNINVWVYRMFESDQRDREEYEDGDDWGQIAKKDGFRRDRIKAIIEKGGLIVSDDYFHAAMIMHHGTDSSDYKLANDLAEKAVGLDSTNYDARWLYAASKDRYLLKIGKPQIYGTQYNYRDGIWTLEPFDKSAVSDGDRKYWRVPSIAEAQRKVARMNSQ